MAVKEKRLSLGDLASMLARAEFSVPVGSYWRHYASGDIYEVNGYGINEATQEVEVEYSPVRDERYPSRVFLGEPDLSILRFHRPFREWEEKVPNPRHPEDASSPLAHRFTRVERVERFEEVKDIYR